MTYIAFKLQFYILSALAFPGNRTHDLGVASAMLYHLSYRKAIFDYIADIAISDVNLAEKQTNKQSGRMLHDIQTLLIMLVLKHVFLLNIDAFYHV